MLMDKLEKTLRYLVDLAERTHAGTAKYTLWLPGGGTLDIVYTAAKK